MRTRLNCTAPAVPVVAASCLHWNGAMLRHRAQAGDATQDGVTVGLPPQGDPHNNLLSALIPSNTQGASAAERAQPMGTSHRQLRWGACSSSFLIPIYFWLPSCHK